MEYLCADLGPGVISDLDSLVACYIIMSRATCKT